MKNSIALKYRNLLIFSIMLIATHTIYGQSNLYNAKGQLFLDTTLSITQEQYKIWKRAEPNILSILAWNIDYPKLSRDAEISGIVIISISCDSVELKNITLIRELNDELEKAIMDGMAKASDKIVRELRFAQNSIDKGKSYYMGTYFIPFNFTLIDHFKLMEENKAIPIVDILPLLIEIHDP